MCVQSRPKSFTPAVLDADCDPVEFKDLIPAGPAQATTGFAQTHLILSTVQTDERKEPKKLIFLKYFPNAVEQSRVSNTASKCDGVLSRTRVCSSPCSLSVGFKCKPVSTVHFGGRCMLWVTYPSFLMIPSTLMRFPVPNALTHPRSVILPNTTFHCGNGVLWVVRLSLLSPNMSSISVAKELEFRVPPHHRT